MMKNHKIWILACTLTGGFAFGQTVNYGGLYIQPNTEMSSLFPLENKEGATVFNNGTLYLYNNLKNDGFFDFVENNANKKKAAKTIFSSNQPQLINGSQLIRMNNVLFQNSTEKQAFIVETGIVAKGIVEFENGIISVDETNGSFVFLEGSKALYASDKSHVNGMVDKEGKEAFVFPIGNEGYYRYSAISAPAKSKDVFVSKYIYGDEQFYTKHTNVNHSILSLNKKEYWVVEKASDVTNDVFLELSWDNRTTDSSVLTDPEKNLRIVRWDEKQLMWVNEGGVVDMGNKTVTTVTALKGYGVFTLATVNIDEILDGDVVIYNIVTPDNDGVNDYFFIENINRFPNNSVQIYNRWGAKVFETKNYDSNGNVFRGYSDNRMTISKNEKLPSGTYYYIVNYQYEKDGVSKPIKKAGYLHLETK